MKVRIVRGVIIFLLLIVSMLYGILSSIYQLPPYTLIQSLYRNRRTPDMTLPEYYLDTQASDLIHIDDTADIDIVRLKLVRFLWGTNLPEDSLPDHVERGIQDQRFNDIPALERIDRITIDMEFGLRSSVYYFHPQKPNNKIILYHQGHEGDFFNGKQYIARFLDNGFAVLAFSMPLLEPNNQPILDLPHLGRLKLSWHDQMKFLAPQQGHPIKYFVEPVVVSLNYLDQHELYAWVAITGISGGGWTSTLAAAVDPRIRLSFPVAGSYPIYLRSESPRDWGDWEQTEPALYSNVNYLELYILGAHGAGRKQLQIINKYDSCCFAGIKWQTYIDIVRQRVFELGAGEFDLFMDDTHEEHIISDTALKKILDELQNTR